MWILVSVHWIPQYHWPSNMSYLSQHTDSFHGVTNSALIFRLIRFAICRRIIVCTNAQRSNSWSVPISIQPILERSLFILSLTVLIYMMQFRVHVINKLFLHEPETRFQIVYTVYVVCTVYTFKWIIRHYFHTPKPADSTVTHTINAYFCFEVKTCNPSAHIRMQMQISIKLTRLKS